MKKFILLFLYILFTVNLFIIPIVHAAEETRTVSDFIIDEVDKQPALLQEFENLDGSVRNQILENSKSIGKEKNTFVEKVARDISAKIYNSALKNEYLKQNINLLLPDAVAQINQLNLLNVKDYEAFKKLALKAGIDLNPKDLNKLSRGSLIGFDSPDLKWTTQKTKDGKSLNVIGNSEAGVWLNLEDIPMATQRMEYDSSNKQFVLTMKDGGKVIVGKGVVNSDGEFKAFSKVDLEGIGKSFSKNPNFKMDFKNLEVKKGEVLLFEDKIELKGETQATFGEFTFNRNKDESSGTSTIKFDGNKILLTGTEMKYDNAEKIGSTTTPFLYIQGDYKKEAVRMSHMQDYGIGLTAMGGGGAIGYAAPPTTGVYRDLYQYYDELGKLTALSSDGKSWVNVNDKEGLDNLYYLGRKDNKYNHYGEFTKSLINDLNSGKTLTFRDVETRFYNKDNLKKEGRQLLIEQLYENFYARNGNQLDIGGKGNVELLKSSDILRVHDAKGFDFQVGQNVFSFSEKGVSSPTKSLSGEIEVPFIDQLSDNQVIKKYSLAKDSSGTLIFNDDRKTVYLGGKAGSVAIPVKIGNSVLKATMSPSGNLIMSEQDFNAVKTKTEASSDNQREIMIQETLTKNSLVLRANLGLDVEGVTIDSKNIKQYVQDNNLAGTLGNLLATGKANVEGLDLGIINPDAKGSLYIKPEIVDTFSNALIDSAQGMGTIDLSKLSVEIGKNSLTVISGDKRGKSVPITTTLTTTSVGKQTFSEDLGKDALETALRLPDSSLGKTSVYLKQYLSEQSTKYGLSLTKYAFESQMGSGRFGLTSKTWAKVLHKPDKIFFEGVDPGLWDSKTGTGLFEKWFTTVKPSVK